MRIDLTDAHCCHSNDEPGAIWTEAQGGDFLVRLHSVRKEGLLGFLNVPQSDDAVETAAYKSILMKRRKAD